MAMPWFEAARELQRSSFYRQSKHRWRWFEMCLAPCMPLI
uniref:Uncharacterized protein n=1 Tax=Setaria viridis TaxID=4556 RepID=A0A4U6U140_SETVI|nr:hypothetical protein SEVIR_6G074433v2 [Setaria viridis]